MEMKTKGNNRFLRIIALPYRALIRARDLYVTRITECTNANVVGLRGVSAAPPLPRSYSSADTDDFRELVRAASATWRGARVEAEIKARAAASTGLPPRSVSVGMGRIDEEKPMVDDRSFGDGTAGGLSRELRYPRSKSHAVVRSKNFRHDLIACTRS